MISNAFLYLVCIILLVVRPGVAAEAPLTLDEQQAAALKQDAEQSARDQKKLQSLAEAQAGINHVRSFTIKVIDQDGNPVRAVPIFGSGKKYLSTILPSGKMFDAETVYAQTDDQGIAKTKPIEGGTFNFSIVADQLPEGYDCTTSQTIDFQGATPDLTGRGDLANQLHATPGIDWIFFVRRGLIPHPLVEFRRDLENITLDGASFSWPIIHPMYARTDVAKGVNAKAEPFADFKIRFWFDSQASKSVDYPRKLLTDKGVQRRLVNDDASWWLEVEAIRGGLQSIEPLKNGVLPEYLAPELGYVSRFLWIKDNQFPKLSTSPKRTFWWRRSGVPTRYARMEFTIYSQLDYATQRHLTVSLGAHVIANPAPEDRLIMLPIQRDPKWITDLTEQFAMSWLAEPVGDPDLTIRQVEPQLVPASNK